MQWQSNLGQKKKIRKQKQKQQNKETFIADIQCVCVCFFFQNSAPRASQIAEAGKKACSISILFLF